MTHATSDDLLSVEASADPHGALRRLAPDGRVVWNARWGGWLVTRHADVAAVLADPERFTSRAFDRIPADAPERARWPEVFRVMASAIVYRDPPEHTRMRALYTQAFTRRAVDGMRPRIQAIAADLLDRLTPDHDVDLVHEYAAPLPVRVIAEMIGAPAEDGPRIKVWSDDIALLMLGAVGDAHRHDRADAALGELSRYFTALVRDRRRAPRDDLASALLASPDATARLTDEEIGNHCGLLVFAGHETTTNLIANAVLALLDHPAQLARAAAGLSTAAIDELLRYDGPMKAITRTATVDADIAGQPVRAGDRVLLSLAAANRDPARFTAPDVLDLARPEAGHLALGYGPHYCLGAPLAKLEAQLALGALLTRHPRLTLAVPRDALTWRRALLVRSLTRLPVRLTPPA